MDYLIDSDVIIDFEKLKEPGLTYFKTAAKQKSFISVISYSEVLFGILDQDSSSTKINFFENLLRDFKVNLLPVNKAEILEFTSLNLNLKKSSVLIPDFDLIIAASAMANNLTLVTRNTKHFSRIPNLKLFSPKSQ